MQKTKTPFYCFLKCLWSILFLGLTPLVAQQLSFQNLTPRDGIPSAYLYDIIQSDDSYFWVTCESGLFSYDGKNFDAVAAAKGFKKEIIDFILDQQGRIWLIDLNGKVSYFENGQFHLASYQPQTNQYRLVKIFGGIPNQVHICDDQGLHIYEKDSLYQFPIDNTDDNLSGWKTFQILSDSTVVLLTYKGVHFLRPQAYEYKKFDQPFRDGGVGFSATLGDSILFSSHDKLYFYLPKKHELIPAFADQEAYFNSEILSFSYNKKKRDILISTGDGGVYLSPTKSGSFKASRFLENKVLGNSLKDHEGNLWITSEREGLFFLSNHRIELLNLDSETQPISILKTAGKDKLIIGYESGRIVIIDQTHKVLVDTHASEYKSRMYDIIVDQKGHYHFFTSGGYEQWDAAFNPVGKIKKSSFKCAELGPDGTIWVGTVSSVGKMKDGNIAEIMPSRTYSIYPLGPDEAWIGTTPGLFYYKNGTASPVERPLLKQDIRDIEMGSSGELWLATQGNGVIVYHPKQDSVWHHFTTADGMTSNHCRQVVLDKEHAWLSTKKGINKIHQSQHYIHAICNDEGLPSNEVNYIQSWQDQLYVATNCGIAYFPDTFQVKRDPPLLRIEAIKINERDTLLQDRFELPYHQNNLKIEYIGITFLHANEVEYAHRMEGFEGDWIYSKIDEVHYPNLSPGAYKFRLKTKTLNSNWSEETQIMFEVTKPFWKTWWFFLFIILSAGSVGGWITSWFLKVSSSRLAEERKLQTSQLTALRAQMNPHFVFNALNSIQEFILNNDSRAANRYLSQFARLMRNVLNFSDA